ncbi:MAG: hypothetical protein KJ626_12785 [Verrucomicrobia bacterium]|nr:hypothetical protein [Verrucomicrobiota bacterium]
MSDNPIERHIPGTIYEIIACFGSGCLVFMLGALAVLDPAFVKRAAKFVLALDFPEQVGLMIVAVTLAYVYGQLSSTLSAPFVADPVGKIVKCLGKRASPDFRTGFESAVNAYGLSEKLPQDKRNNKWTLMFYLQAKAPEIGADIMKRYAREKLARINAFNMMVLTLLTLASLLCGHLQIGQRFGVTEILKVANPWWLVLYLALCATYSYEYYKRKCWNNDLLLKVLPVAGIAPAPDRDAKK